MSLDNEISYYYNGLKYRSIDINVEGDNFIIDLIDTSNPQIRLMLPTDVLIEKVTHVDHIGIVLSCNSIHEVITIYPVNHKNADHVVGIINNGRIEHNSNINNERTTICMSTEDNSETDQTGAKKDSINPAHYKQYPIESIDMMLKLFGKEAVCNFCLLNAFKYRMRLGHKDDVRQDLEKEKWYMNKYNELK